MSEEVKGYQLETCFGADGCPNRAVESGKLLERLEKRLKKENLRQFLEKNVEGGLKHHHEFRASVADCPNACSQPQIKDLGILGAVKPILTERACSFCGDCLDACSEDAITLEGPNEAPVIDVDRCVMCGKCGETCPTGTLDFGRRGYRVQLGGKLGRRPRLAEELPGIYSEDDIIDILKKCISFYKAKSKNGKRFAEIFQHPSDLDL
jgi:dissimilatory sulfite reductase (desulfoviridin) alpha/beta subunit